MKKAQIWSFDLIIASIIFSLGILVLYIYAINHLNPSKNKLDSLTAAGNTISELLLSEENYGLLSNNKINQSKLDYFDSLSDEEKKNLLGVSNNFYFTFEGLEVNGHPKDAVGIINQGHVKNSIKVTRIAIYKNKPIKFELYVWE